MITLCVENYCHDCPGFEAEVDRYNLDDDTGDGANHLTTITCKSKRRCAAMIRYLKKAHDKEVISDAN